MANSIEDKTLCIGILKLKGLDEVGLEVSLKGWPRAHISVVFFYFLLF
jgi:hypothetical protein